MNQDKRPLVVYHAQCYDGWCAAWIAKRAMPDAELRPAFYGDEFPSDCVGRDIYVLDFSYRSTSAYGPRSLTVLEHHKTAQEALGILKYNASKDRAYRTTIVFDMQRSGAGIAWDHFFPDEKRPWFVNYVEDRDLWRWALPNSREINAYLGTLPYGKPEHLAAWDEVFNNNIGPSDAQAADWLVSAGRVALDATKRYAEAACENAVWRELKVPLGHPSLPRWLRGDAIVRVPSVNAQQHAISEVLETLIDLHPDAPFVHGWWQRADGLVSNSLRSRGEFDVSEVAKRYGGGGHKNAAGFQTSDALPTVMA